MRFELVENRFADQESVFGEHDLKHIFAQAAGGERSYQNVGVQ